MEAGMLKQAILFLLIILNLETSWGSPDPAELQSSEVESATPVLLEKDAAENKIGILTVDGQITSGEQDLTKLRQELIGLEKKSHKDVFISTSKRFPMETFTFFVAAGAVTYNTMWIKSGGDPLAMEKHILSLKDPISHISFYTFMQANGFYTNFHTSRLASASMDPVIRNQMLRRISYQGLAVGSLASSIVSDVGMSIQMCANEWLKGKKDEESLQSCNEAKKQWTARRKFSQYFPQIITLWTSQAITEMLESSAHKAFTAVSKTNKIQSLKTGFKNIQKAFKISSADVLITIAPGGASSKILKFAGSVTKFGAFLAIDQVVTKYLNRPLNNAVLTWFGTFDTLSVTMLWNELDKNNWNLKTTKKTHFESFVKEIEKYTENSTQWRNHINEQVELDFSGWMEMTNKILNQVDYANKFYKQFSSELAENLKVRQQVAQGKLESSALGQISHYPFRLLPFFGVTPGEYKTVSGNSIDEYYLLNPNELEKRQREHILQVAQEFLAKRYMGFKNGEYGLFKEILNLLNSGIDYKMAVGLKKINDIYHPYMTSTVLKASGSINPALSLAGHTMSLTQKKYSIEFIKELFSLRSKLGDPRPAMNPLEGFARAVDVNSVYKQSASLARFGKWSLRKGYILSRPSDLMIYNIICGQAVGKLNKTKFLGQDMFSPEFAPPALVKNGQDREQYCDDLTVGRTMYSNKTIGINVTKMILNNIDSQAIGSAGQGYDSDLFDQWWTKKVSQSVNKEFNQYDKSFRKVVAEFNENYNKKRNWYQVASDVIFNMDESQFPSGVKESLKLEENTYLQIINRALMAEVSLHKNKNDMFDYMHSIAKLAGQEKFSSIYKKSIVEVREIHSLFNEYHKLINLEKMDEKTFNQFIMTSQKMDEAINGVLVYAGYKKLIQSEETGDPLLDLFSSGENASKRYENIDVKNPNYKQQIILAAVKGLRSVENELKRYIRMRVVLKHKLEMENKEILALSAQ